MCSAPRGRLSALRDPFFMNGGAVLDWAAGRCRRPRAEGAAGSARRGLLRGKARLGLAAGRQSRLLGARPVQTAALLGPRPVPG